MRYIPCIVLFFVSNSGVFAQRGEGTEPTQSWSGEVVVPERLEPKQLPSKRRVQNSYADSPFAESNKTFVIDNAADFEKLWKILKREDKLPTIDFAKSSAIVVLTKAFRFQIKMSNGKLMLNYALGLELPPKKDGKNADVRQSYAIAVFPKNLVDGLPKYEKPTSGVDEDALAAWKKRGAMVEWYGQSPDNTGMLFADERRMFKDPIPVFRFREETGNEDLRMLPAMESPFGLSLANTKITNAGLKAIKGCKNLAVLRLVSTEVTGDGLKELKDCGSLTSLWLNHTKVDDSAAPFLKQLKHLTTLSLSDTRIGDKSLAAIKELTDLSDLHLSGLRRITDKGLSELKTLKKLTYLDVSGSASDKAIQDLQKALPKCKIKSSRFGGK